MHRCESLRSCCRRLASVCLLGALGISTALAQLKGHNIPGDFGLQSGTQPPAGIYLANVLWIYNSDTLKSGQGDAFKVSGDLTSTMESPAVSWVTPFRLFGAHVGGTAAFPFLKNRLEANSLDVNTPMKYTDMYVQPFQLGWHMKRSDIVLGYGVFLPTGKFEPGGDDNSGLGMTSQEISFGSTIFLDDEKGWLLQGKKDRIFGVGPEFNTFLPKLKLTLGVRFLPEFRGRLHTQGSTLVISAAYVLKPFAP